MDIAEILRKVEIPLPDKVEGTFPVIRLELCLMDCGTTSKVAVRQPRIGEQPPIFYPLEGKWTDYRVAKEHFDNLKDKFYRGYAAIAQSDGSVRFEFYCDLETDRG
ncbi:hypothetical protein HY638_05650 [Candidatus Woesearchaeota archaeon]|nr:hypothetical protein [Candidatus Woesearchaeota archaeon]